MVNSKHTYKVPGKVCYLYTLTYPRREWVKAREQERRQLEDLYR